MFPVVMCRLLSISNVYIASARETISAVQVSLLEFTVIHFGIKTVTRQCWYLEHRSKVIQ